MKHSSFWKVFGGCEIRFSIRGARQFWVRDKECGVFELTGKAGTRVLQSQQRAKKLIMKGIMNGVTPSVFLSFSILSSIFLAVFF